MGAMKQIAIRLADRHSLDNADEHARDEMLAGYHAEENALLRRTNDKLAAELVLMGRIRAENALLRVRLDRLNRNRCSRFDRQWAELQHAYGDEDCPEPSPAA